MLANVAALAFTVALTAIGIWLAVSIADLRKTQDCVLMGRRDCARISVTPQGNSARHPFQTAGPVARMERAHPGIASRALTRPVDCAALLIRAKSARLFEVRVAFSQRLRVVRESFRRARAQSGSKISLQSGYAYILLAVSGPAQSKRLRMAPDQRQSLFCLARFRFG